GDYKFGRTVKFEVYGSDATQCASLPATQFGNNFGVNAIYSAEIHAWEGNAGGEDTDLVV
ncbi:MAG: hypothetical protein KDN22_21105, partial [Verrucomicrobiae bacterium]|nr:hypothetical protein [Verrucomicrobiae bacterium]